MKLQSEAQTEAELLSTLQPGSEGYNRHSVRPAELNARNEAGREQAEAESDRRRAEAAATIYKEIQDAVAALCKRRGSPTS